MNRFPFGVAISYIIVILSLWGALVNAQESSLYPYIYLEYSPAFDSKFCSTSLEITPSWIKSAQVIAPLLQEAWDKEAPHLLGRVVRLIKPFRSAGENALLFLCRSQKNVAFPLLLSAWPFIPEATSGHPLPISEFKFIIFHEILHRFVMENVDYRHPTPLIIKYRAESENVRVHLHVMAIQKLIYLNLDPSGGQLKQLLYYEYGYGTDYKRAWQIIDEIGYLPFVEELR